jgi:hypothetical protein
MARIDYSLNWKIGKPIDMDLRRNHGAAKPLTAMVITSGSELKWDTWENLQSVNLRGPSFWFL